MDIDSIQELYSTAFPPKERREFEDLKEMFFVPECFINQIIANDDKVAGLCIFWVFNEFLFIEHFAVFPDLRGFGIGEETLSVLQGKYPLILLETELPVDEISRRRVKFYERNGFALQHLQYFQPSYSTGEPIIELKIMSSIHNLPHEKLDQFLLQIKEKVYQHKTKK